MIPEYKHRSPLGVTETKTEQKIVAFKNLSIITGGFTECMYYEMTSKLSLSNTYHSI